MERKQSKSLRRNCKAVKRIEQIGKSGISILLVIVIILSIITIPTKVVAVGTPDPAYFGEWSTGEYSRYSNTFVINVTISATECEYTISGDIEGSVTISISDWIGTDVDPGPYFEYEFGYELTGVVTDNVSGIFADPAGYYALSEGDVFSITVSLNNVGAKIRTNDSRRW